MQPTNKCYHLVCTLADQDKHIDTCFTPYPGLVLKISQNFSNLPFLSDPPPTIKDVKVILLP